MAAIGLLACALVIILLFSAHAQPLPVSVPREVLAFYYGWYGTPEGSGEWRHWSGVKPQAQHIANSTHYPVGGAYDSLDASAIRQQFGHMRQAGLTGLVVSWWGRDSFEDRSLQLIMAMASQADLKISGYYETLPWGHEHMTSNARVNAALKDISYLLDRYGQDRAWLRVEGRPVLFVYARAIQQLGPDGWGRLIDQLKASGDAPWLIGDLGGASSYHEMRVFSGVHSYNNAPATAEMNAERIERWAARAFAAQLRPWADKIRCLTISPGYDDRPASGNPDPRRVTPRNDGDTLAAMGRSAIACRPDWLLVTSWNEWHEGTEVEPSIEHGMMALTELRCITARFMALPPRVVPLDRLQPPLG